MRPLSLAEASIQPKTSRFRSAPWVHYGNGSFSAVSRLQIARVGAFFSIFQDLQDYNTSAPLRSQNLSRKAVTIFAIFSDFLKKIRAFLVLFGQFCYFCSQISWKFIGTSRKCLENAEIDQICRVIAEILRPVSEISGICDEIKAVFLVHPGCTISE